MNPLSMGIDEDSFMSKEYTITGGTILVFGDLHLSSEYKGTHKVYLAECLHNMTRIKDIVEEKKPSAIFFLGDIIGVKERNIRDRRFFREVLSFFMYLNSICPVFSVKGNHDFGDYSDFDLLIGLQFIKNPRFVDFRDEKGNLHVRFHFVNYGYEKKPLKFPEEEGASNVVLCHSDIQIPGVTNWYKTNNGYVLSSMENWKGVDYVFAGHIHTPSLEFNYTVMDGNSVGLFYVGSPSRVAERFDECWYLQFSHSSEGDTVDGNVQFSAELFGLQKASEVFVEEETIISDDDVRTYEELRQESLVNIVKEVMEGRMATGDIFNQIQRLPGASQRAKEIASNYLHRAMDEVKSR